MPYYCTVPRCTSMAGKAKNVSFHQFPRDEELARLWNDILKRGKPYTKYSKVCSLHFKPEDYTITSVGKNKGQWRTLRKDAVPSQNLPSETPAPYSRKQWDSCSQGAQNVLDPSIHQQMAQAIYMQTMLAMQAAGTDATTHQNGPKQDLPNTSTHEELLNSKQNDCTYQCTECSKCFKDPDVFILHKRTHTKDKSEKENYNMNLTLRSNPILANLLNSNSYNFDPNMLSMENLLMTALAANMDYLRNYSTIKDDNYDFENRTEYENSDGNEIAIENQSTNRLDTELNNVDLSDLSRLKSDLSRRSVEIHVRNDTSQSKNNMTHSRDDLTKKDYIQVRNDLAVLQNKVNDIHSPPTENQRNVATNYGEQNGNSDYDIATPIGYAVNFRSKEIVDQIVKRSYNTECNDIVTHDSAVKGDSTKNVTLCDNDLNESLDSNSLVIDESA